MFHSSDVFRKEQWIQLLNHMNLTQDSIQRTFWWLQINCQEHSKFGTILLAAKFRTQKCWLLCYNWAGCHWVYSPIYSNEHFLKLECPKLCDYLNGNVINFKTVRNFEIIFKIMMKSKNEVSKIKFTSYRLDEITWDLDIHRVLVELKKWNTQKWGKTYLEHSAK